MDDLKNKLSKIKMLAMDVDGTLTDGGLYYSDSGLQMKRFHAHDGMGVRSLQESGFKTLVITSDNSEIPIRRGEKLHFTHTVISSFNKIENLKTILMAEGLEASEVAYIGDDINDLECMQICGFSCCPADSVDVVKSSVDYVCKRNGGQGAVREICDIILEHSQKNILF